MFDEAIKLINKSENILILPHVNQDGDALGSCYGLYLILKAIGKNAFVMRDGDHEYCDYLYGARDDEPLTAYDLAIAVDCADAGRLGDRYKYFAECDKSIVIDHHSTNTFFGGVNIVDAEASASAELIYKLALELEFKMTPQVASNLYLGLSADTGCFQYSSVTPETMRIGADLIEMGAENAKINELLYSTNSLAKLKLMRIALDSLEVFADGRISCVCLTHDEIKSSGAKPEECDGIVSIPRSLNTADIALFIHENADGTIKISMRSNENADVSEICGLFGGGGHKRAAGCSMNCSIEEAKKTVVEQCEKYLEG